MRVNEAEADRRVAFRFRLDERHLIGVPPDDHGALDRQSVGREAGEALGERDRLRTDGGEQVAKRVRPPRGRAGGGVPGPAGGFARMRCIGAHRANPLPLSGRGRCGDCNGRMATDGSGRFGMTGTAHRLPVRAPVRAREDRGFQRQESRYALLLSGLSACRKAWCVRRQQPADGGGDVGLAH